MSDRWWNWTEFLIDQQFTLVSFSCLMVEYDGENVRWTIQISWKFSRCPSGNNCENAQCLVRLANWSTHLCRSIFRMNKTNFLGLWSLSSSSRNISSCNCICWSVFIQYNQSSQSEITIIRNYSLVHRIENWSIQTSAIDRSFLLRLVFFSLGNLSTTNFGIRLCDW